MTPTLRASITGLGIVTDEFTHVRAFAQHLPSQINENALQKLIHAAVLDASNVETYDTITQLVLRASHQALSMADLLDETGKAKDGEKMALLFVSEWGTIDATVAYLESMLDKEGRYASPRHFSRSVYSSVASLAAIHFGIHGPCQTLCFPESPISAALTAAARLLALQRARQVLLVFAEQSASIAAELSQLAVQKLHQRKFSIYAQQPLGCGAVAFLLQGPEKSGITQLPLPLEAPPLPPKRNIRPFPMQEALQWAEAVLTLPGHG
ncbi:MAG TPA: beta-ketoacyl synthase chain length factor [Phycisphaerae bacterium]|jgi:3-oxoacyl-(acyl-carrier-protein) synthase